MTIPTHLIVAHDVANQGFDREQLSPMASAAKAALGQDDLHAIADKGYFSGPEILACHEASITTTVPRPATSGTAAKGMYVKADFVYDAERDVYVCPAGEDLIFRYTTEERGIPIRRYWINGCKTCPLRTNCTTGNEWRISRWEREDLVDDMDSRLGRDPDYMTLRRCTFEHPFGLIKAWMGGTHFLTRRLKNVRSEMALNLLAYNTKRMVAMLGVRGLMRAIQGRSRTWTTPLDRTVAVRDHSEAWLYALFPPDARCRLSCSVPLANPASSARFHTASALSGRSEPSFYHPQKGFPR